LKVNYFTSLLIIGHAHQPLTEYCYISREVHVKLYLRR